jgi:hypothetical protein
MPDPEALALQDRLWNAFPVSQPAFAKLLGLLDIEISREVPTAAVTLGTLSRLTINPDFAARHCATDAALVTLVLHELYHVALGHTRLCERPTPRHNFAFDAVINAQLCLLQPGPEWTRLFRELYGAQDRPWCLLRPPEGWGTPLETWLPGSLGALHRRLYSDTSTSCEDLFRLLADCGEDAFPGVPEEGGGEAVLLGSHGEAREEEIDPGVLAEIREIIAQWPRFTRQSGRDLGGPARNFRLDLREARRAATAALRRALLGLGDRGGDGSGSPRAAGAPSQGVFPHRCGGDRRAGVLEACGGEPLFFQGERPRRILRRGDRVHVYFDVSGSMDELIAPLYAALIPLTSWLAPRIHLFSTQVRDITLGELKRGRVATTDGTDIRAVTAHLASHGVRRALIVTDGWVGAVPSEHARELRRRGSRIAVALVPGGDPAFAAALGATVLNLPETSRGTP